MHLFMQTSWLAFLMLLPAQRANARAVGNLDILSSDITVTSTTTLTVTYLWACPEVTTVHAMAHHDLPTPSTSSSSSTASSTIVHGPNAQANKKVAFQPSSTTTLVIVTTVFAYSTPCREVSTVHDYSKDDRTVSLVYVPIWAPSSLGSGSNNHIDSTRNDFRPVTALSTEDPYRTWKFPTVPSSETTSASLVRNSTTSVIITNSATMVIVEPPVTSSVYSVVQSAIILPSTYTTTSAIPKPSTCGESGNFTLNWDDEPAFTPTNDTDVSFPPIFNPYHHLFFSNGYVYAPPPSDPFPPISPPKLAIFFPNLTDVDAGSPNAAGVYRGEIGAGPRASSSAFWFNASGAYLGCDNKGPQQCIMHIAGYKWNAKKVTVQQRFLLQPCPGLVDCHLKYVAFNKEFVGLSGLRIEAKVGHEERAFFMDNLSMAWYNNSCEAGLERRMSRK